MNMKKVLSLALLITLPHKTTAATTVDGVNVPTTKGDFLYRQLTTGKYDWIKDLGHAAMYLGKPVGYAEPIIIEVLDHEKKAIQVNTLQSFYDANGLYLGAAYGQLPEDGYNSTLTRGLVQRSYGSSYTLSNKYVLGSSKTTWETVNGRLEKVITKIPGKFRCDTFMNYIHNDKFAENDDYISPRKVYNSIADKR